MTDSSENTRNYYRNQGATQERERIIKLLEEHTINGKHGVTPHGNSHFWEMGMKYAIALIKGDDFCRHLIALIKGEQK